VYIGDGVNKMQGREKTSMDVPIIVQKMDWVKTFGPKNTGEIGGRGGVTRG